MNNIHKYHIDYDLLSKAKQFYGKRGFCSIEVPWIVDKKYSLVTTSNDKAFATKPSKHFVGSAEQAFLQLAFRNKLVEYHRYQSITPCFRRDKEDESHGQWFMKLELFEYCTNIESSHLRKNLGFDYPWFISSAHSFFSSLAPEGTDIKIIPTEGGGSDIMINGVEVGSYGKRCHENVTWLYGTGIALPRFNYALSVAVT